MNETYGEAKAACYPEAILAFRAGRVPPPVQVLVSPCDTCNHRCAWCSFRQASSPVSELFLRPDGRPPSRHLARSVWLDLLNDCVRLGVQAIQLTGGGEPLMHPDADQLLADVLDHGLALGLVTNGTLVKASHVKTLAHAAWVRVSINAGQERTYREIHRCKGPGWKQAWEAVAALARLRGPEVGVSIVLCDCNWSEIGTFLELAQVAGAHNVRITTDVHQPGVLTGERYEHVRRTIAGVHGLRVHFRPDPDVRPPTHPDCLYQHLAPYVGADAAVYRCCNTAYTSRGFLGYLVRDRFAALMERRSLEGFNAQLCSQCAFKQKNAVLRSLVSGPQRHDLFP